MQKGFTLIELMIVVAIIGILSFIGGVSISSNIIKNSVKKVESQVPAYLRNAIDIAYEEGSHYTITFNKNSIDLSGKDSLNLPRNLQYFYRTGTSNPVKISAGKSINIDNQGGLDKEFDFYVKDSKNNYYYRIHGRNISGIDLGVIEEYNAISTGFDKNDIKKDSNWILIN